ncbi:MAG: divalent-cation tolerance protein CutA [Verrucomicrobiota bacterium]|nr:divalent-cation tolerance protein CutA [Verrucomicrobiota bacterium]
MQQARRFYLVLVTAPDLKTARRLAQNIVKNRLAACANLIPKIESHFWWQGKLERANEILILFKTTKKNLPELEKNILENHSYDTPEFVVLSVSAGNKRYLDWLAQSVR